jgi:tetratricopeptide (TPR) repeat protein
VNIIRNDEKNKRMKRKKAVWTLLLICCSFISIHAQINTDKVLTIGRNALYFEDYVLSIQYFNQVIRSKPFLAEPYLYRAVAKLNLDDYKGAEDDLNQCIAINPFLVYSYLYRGIARQYQNDFKGAIEDYTKGLEYSPENKEIIMNKGIAYGQDKNYDAAIATLNLLVRYQPKFAQAYTTRGSFYAEKGDTVRALNDYSKSLELDKYFAPTYAQRGMIYYQQSNYKEALSDYNEAIRLEPKQIGYYINRGLIKYNLTDLRGAMADYDAVIILDAQNTIGRFNRGLLLSQVGDASRAVEDFNVAIANEPDNYMAIYNRAILNKELKNYKNAIADLDQVLNEYPYFVPGYYFRSELKRAINDAKGADKDYWYAYDLEQKLKKEKTAGKIITGKGIYNRSEYADNTETTDGKNTRERSDKDIEKFNKLVSYDKEEEVKSSYKNEIRGRVQDRQVKVDLAPQFVVTYYEKPEDIDKTVARYNKTISDYNARMILKMQLKVVNNEAALSDQQAEYHFHSIDDYSLTIDKNPNNADAYFGKALDFMVLQDLTEAQNNFTKAINLRSDFVLAYFDRAVVRSKLMQLENSIENAASRMEEQQNINLINIQNKANKLSQPTANPYTQPKIEPDNSFSDKDNNKVFNYDQIIQDYNKVIQLDPNFVYAYYNRANIWGYQKNYREAVADYTEAINRNPEFAEAYYNRGLTRLSLGDTSKGIADLSKAGELGIIEAYSIIKKMTAD